MPGVSAGQGKEVGGERCGKRAARGGIAALSGQRAALSGRAGVNDKRGIPRTVSSRIGAEPPLVDFRPSVTKPGAEAERNAPPFPAHQRETASEPHG